MRETGGRAVEGLNGVLLMAGALARLGCWGEALATVEQAAAEQRQDEAESSLADVLARVTADLAGLHAGAPMAHDRAIAVLRQIAAVYRRLAPDDHAFAVTLRLLAEAEWDLGRAERALTHDREALPVRRRLARTGSLEHRRQLVRTLERLSRGLRAVGKRRAAAKAAAEASELAVELWR